MKRFGSLLLAAVMGSVITVAVNRMVPQQESAPTIERVTTVPGKQVTFTANENGEAVPLDFTGTAEKVTASVVHIRAKSEGRTTSRRGNDPFEFFFGPQGPGQSGPSMSSGSGVIINKDGYIVTNNHVVEGAEEVEVTLSNNRHYRAEVIGTDPDTDIGLIKIDRKDLPALAFVNSDNVKVGEWVLAVGNPFNLNSTVTAGIISAKGRNIGLLQGGSTSQDPAARTAIESFIQTDAAINPGNSGGALVNLNGDLIGINTAIASTTGSYAGYGFAVPSNIVSKIVEDLMAYGTVQRGWLGIKVGTVDENAVRTFDLEVDEGAVVSGFAPSNSAAKDAGIKEGDVIVKLDNMPITSNTQLIEYVGMKRPGDKISVTIDRKGKQLIIPVTLRNRDGKEEAVKREEKGSVESLGLTLENIDAGELRELELSAGVRVKGLESGKVAKYTEMKEGFIITHIDSTPVKSVKQANELLTRKKPGETVLFTGVYENFSREYIYALRM